MAENAGEIIRDALQEINVQATEEPITGDELQTGIRYLNRMMDEFEAQGIRLGFTAVTNLVDPITVQAGAINGIIFNLALRLAPQFDEPITPTLSGNAADGLKAMRKLGVQLKETQLGGTVPFGSGNDTDFHDNDFHFFPPVISAEGKLEFTGNAANTVIATIGVGVLVNAVWEIKTQIRMTGSVAGRLTFQTSDSFSSNNTFIRDVDESFQMRAQALIEPVSGQDSIGIAIAINGTPRPNSLRTKFVVAGQPTFISTVLGESLSKDDFVEVYAFNLSSDIDLLVSEGELRAMS